MNRRSFFRTMIGGVVAGIASHWLPSLQAAPFDSRIDEMNLEYWGTMQYLTWDDIAGVWVLPVPVSSRGLRIPLEVRAGTWEAPQGY